VGVDVVIVPVIHPPTPHKSPLVDTHITILKEISSLPSSDYATSFYRMKCYFRNFLHIFCAISFFLLTT
jgi:hypothetical protein